MSKFVDYKCTVWGRLHFNDEANMEAVIEKLKEGYTPAELCDYPELQFEFFNFIDDTEEFLSVEENDFNSTIEVWVDENVIWENKKINN